MTERRKRILFVDDERPILEGLKNVLFRDRKRWDMVFALGGEAALAELAKLPFDLVVSDMRMPNIDGATLLRAVKDDYPATMRIMLSGHADPEALTRALSVIHELVAKPCDASTLREVLARHLGEGES